MEKKVRRKRQIMRNRTIILRSARELFHKKGFYATTMEDIAQYSGFDRRTIYNHFKNKDEIFAALIATVLSDISAIFDEVALENISSLEKLRGIVFRLLDVYIDNAQLLTIFMSEYESSERKKKRYISTFMLRNIHAYKDIESRMVEMITQAQEDNLIIDVHPYILAGVLNELVLRSVVVLHNNKKSIDKESIIRDILKVLEGNVIKTSAG
ncbi:MAG: TetR/AcrR family transcriptional regulator [Deltaproteobacteria bacterium]|nr:TetR/AcrR family transcriptional regulator [Deltaproteobacteria bacterium]